MSDQSESFAAAEGREFLAGELRDKDPKWIREFAGLVDDPKVLDLLNYYCSLWADEDDDFLDSALGMRILRNAATTTIDEAFRAGNVSQLKGMTGMTGQERDGEDLLSDAAGLLEHEGAIGLVLGPPGSGKTAVTLDVARVWKARTGGSVIGNTGWDGFDEVVQSDRELLEGMAERRGPVLAVIDETAQELSGFGSSNKAAEEFSDSLTFVRKKEAEHGPYPKKGSVLMVNHTKTKTAKPFRDLASFAVEKPSRSDPGRARLLDSEADQDTFQERYTATGLTDTAEQYPEHEASEFTILGDEDEEGDQADPDDVRRQGHIETAIKAVSEQEMTYDDAASLVPYSKEWVGDIYRKWRDKNQYREIVPREDPSEA